MKTTPQRIIVTQGSGEEVPAEVLAQSIVKIAEGMKALDASRLKRETIVLLLQGSTGLPRTTIRVVLDGLQSLQRDWLKAV